LFRKEFNFLSRIIDLKSLINWDYKYKINTIKDFINTVEPENLRNANPERVGSERVGRTASILIYYRLVYGCEFACPDFAGLFLA
jgi:hypothetical protein